MNIELVKNIFLEEKHVFGDIFKAGDRFMYKTYSIAANDPNKFTLIEETGFIYESLEDAEADCTASLQAMNVKKSSKSK